MPALKYNVRPKVGTLFVGRHKTGPAKLRLPDIRVAAPYPWHNVPLMFSRWSEPGLEQFRQEAGLVGHGHARGLQRLYLALCRA